MRVQSVITLLAALLFCRVAGAQTGTRFPSQITTTDGTVYKHTAKLHVYPDGILVSYEPAPHGLGLAKLKFRDLPESLQKQYGYDPKAAAEYEKQEAQAAEEFRTQLSPADTLARYRQLAELNLLLGGAQAASYVVSLDANGKVTAQAMTGTAPTMTVTNVGPPGYAMPPNGMAPPYGSGYPSDYMPQTVPMNPGMTR